MKATPSSGSSDAGVLGLTTFYLQRSDPSGRPEESATSANSRLLRKRFIARIVGCLSCSRSAWSPTDRPRAGNRLGRLRVVEVAATGRAAQNRDAQDDPEPGRRALLDTVSGRLSDPPARRTG